MPNTLGNRSTFEYIGSVATGTDISYGQGHIVHVTADQYAALRAHFLNLAVPVPVGTSRTVPPPNSLGAWLQANVTRTAIASYVAPILVNEGYAVRVVRSNIQVIR